ncbi:hypothetical protein AB0F22_31875, partial [Streptomyces griseoluteus]
MPSGASAAEMPQTTHHVTTAVHRAHSAPQAASAGSGNLDGWIKQSLAIMKAKGIPGTYEGLHRNIMR